MTWNRFRSWFKRTPLPRKRHARPTVEFLEGRVVPSFTVGKNVNISKSFGFDDEETAIVINPTNPLNLFATSTAEQAEGGVNGWFSTDGGKIWKISDFSQIYGG